MTFESISGTSNEYDSAESLFSDLNDCSLPGLLSDQADIIREYHESHEHQSDVAFQLPTGTGKTLIGLLISEWRRRQGFNRCLYLCPTRQLVNQVKKRADEKYGIDVEAFTGSKTSYENAAKSRYRRGKVVAVSTYSSLFNANPFFQSPDFILLDDVHASASYVRDLWALKANKYDHEDVFFAVLELFKDWVQDAYYQEVTRQQSMPYDDWVEFVPVQEVARKRIQLNNILDNLPEDSDARYSLNEIRTNIGKCHVFITKDSVTIRPLIPPTWTHEPFENASQRLYMSATLGDCGDLERRLGRRNISRMEKPASLEQHGVGRRFFIFPSITNSDREDRTEFIEKLVRVSGQAVCVSRNRREREEVSGLMSSFGFTVLEEGDVEEDINRIKQGPDDQVKVLSLTNRYDGLDLSDDLCRVMFVFGLNKVVGAQETFVRNRLGATTVYEGRINSRIVQLIGRCTRSKNDYAAIVGIGESIARLFSDPSRRLKFHPEFQAEFEFGLQNSEGASIDELLNRVDWFLDQGDEWKEHAEKQIVDFRQTVEKETIEGAEELTRAAPKEVRFMEAFWSGHYDRALSCAREVYEELEGGSALAGYRGLWKYLAGAVSCYEQGDTSVEVNSASREYFENAAGACPNVTQFRKLAALDEEGGTASGLAEAGCALVMVEKLEARIDEVGVLTDGELEQRVGELREGLRRVGDSGKFENALKDLGWFLGFDVGNSEAQSAPDPWWWCDNRILVFEAFTGGVNEGATVGSTKVRQLVGHKEWIESNLNVSDRVRIDSIMVTNREGVEDDAKIFADEERFVSVNGIQRLAEKAIEIFSDLRGRFREVGDIEWRRYARHQLEEANFEPEGLLETHFSEKIVEA